LEKKTAQKFAEILLDLLFLFFLFLFSLSIPLFLLFLEFFSDHNGHGYNNIYILLSTFFCFFRPKQWAGP